MKFEVELGEKYVVYALFTFFWFKKIFQNLMKIEIKNMKCCLDKPHDSKPILMIIIIMNYFQ